MLTYLTCRNSSWAVTRLADVRKRWVCRCDLNVTEMTESVEHFLTRCELACLMQELIGSYIMMEEYFMRQMVVKVSYGELTANWKTVQ